MKNGILLKLAIFVGLCAAHQASAWQWTITNWASWPAVIYGTYVGCRDDAKQTINPGETKTFDAKECVLSSITGHGPYGYVVPYKGPTRVYDKFYIIGPINNQLRVGRIEQK